MTKALSVRRVSREKWDALVPMFRDVSYRQCSSYACVAAQHVGAKSELSSLMVDEHVIGLADVRIKQIPMTSFGIAYSSYAPIALRDEQSYERQFGRCLDALREEYVERRHLVLRLTPALHGGLFQDVQVSCLKDRGFYPSGEPARETILIDLGSSMEELRRNLDPKWRSDLAKSEKAGITNTRSVELNDFDQFERIFLQLANQKRFMPNQDVGFFKQVQSTASHPHKFVLHLAWHGNELVAGHLGSFFGKTAVYLLGASTSRGRELRASYLLQWNAIAFGKASGNSFYDLGGIDQQNNPDVYRFKRRLNGRVVREVGPHELAPGFLSKQIIQLAEKARNIRRRSRTR
jgi:lipid II:glycine glycyltransferase (peptidoglycan interpeptide bridge formation enzyme)